MDFGNRPRDLRIADAPWRRAAARLRSAHIAARKVPDAFPEQSGVGKGQASSGHPPLPERIASAHTQSDDC
jgi:hypothetical protein